MTIMEAGVRQRLLRHLENCVAEVDTDLRPQQALSEERLQPPDSSTSEEINNNQGEAQASSASSNPAKILKTCDGSFVFLLPSHYVQLASALGINLRSQQEVEVAGEAPGAECENRVDVEEKPIDFSNNCNETASDMWRPW